MVENMCIFLFPFCPMTLIVRGIAFHLAFFFERFLCHCFGICNCIYQIFNYRVSHIPGVNTFVVAASAQKYFNNKIIHICWEIRKIISSPPAQTCVNEGELLLTPVCHANIRAYFNFRHVLRSSAPAELFSSVAGLQQKENYVVRISPMRSTCRAWTAPLSTV